MTQHLSRLPPSGACSPGRARSSLPNTSFIFRFRAELSAGAGAGAGGRGRQAGGRAGLPVAKWRPSFSSSFLPRSFPGCRWEPGADGVPSPGRAPRARRAQSPRSEGGRGLGGVARPSSRARLRGARRPDGRHFARRPRLGRWRLLRARREEGRRRRSRARGEGRPARRRPRSRPPPAWTPLARGGLDDDRGLRRGLGPRARLGAHAGTRRPHGQEGPWEPVAKDHGDGRGLEGPRDSDRCLPRRGQPSSGPGPDPRPIPAAYPGLGAQVWLPEPEGWGPPLSPVCA